MSRKRYMLFTFYNQYPMGGLNDASGTFDDLDEVKSHLDSMYTVDVKIVKSDRKKPKTTKTKIEIITEHKTVDGPDDFHVLDLDTGEQIDYIPGFSMPEPHYIEISRREYRTE